MGYSENGAASGAASGAAAGSVAGPWGTAIGAVAGGAMGYLGSRKKKKAMEALLAKQRAAIKAEQAWREGRMAEDTQYYGQEAVGRSGDLRGTIDAALGASDPSAAQEQVTGGLSAAMDAVGPVQGSSAFSGTGNAGVQAEATEAQMTQGDNSRLAGAMGVATGNEMAQTARAGELNKFSISDIMRRARMGDYSAKKQLFDKIHQIEYQKKMSQLGAAMGGAQTAGDNYLLAGQMLSLGGKAVGAFSGWGDPASAYSPGEGNYIDSLRMGTAGATDLSGGYGMA